MENTGMTVLKILGAIIAVVIVAAIAVGLGMYFRLIPIPGPILALLVDAKEPEYSARYYPSDTIAYGWITLVPGEGQVGEMEAIWERFNEYPGFRDLVDELKIDFLTETGIDFEEEVMPWIGPEISAGLIDFDLDQELPSAAITIQVRDEDAARNFLEKWREYIEEETGARFDTGSHRGNTTWVDDSEHQAYALTNDWLVYATNESVLHSVLDRMNGDSDDSLADEDKFQAARAALPERRFHSGYVDYQQALDLLGDAAGGFGPVVPGAIGPATFAESAPEWVAMSGSWVERGVVVEMVSPTVTDFGLEVTELRDPALLLPDDTLGFMAAGFDPNVDNWRKALAEYDLRDVLPDPYLLDEINNNLAGMTPDGAPPFDNDATLADALDLGFDLAEQFTGIDLETDFFGHLAGEMIVAVNEFDFEAVSDDPTANAVDATLMLSYLEEGEDGLADTMDEVTGLLEMHVGLTANRTDVGAEREAIIFDPGVLGMMMGGEIAYQPGYVLHDQYLTIGTTVKALSSIVARQKVPSANLASDAEYQRAASHLMADRQFLGYVNVNSIVNQLDADDLGIEAERVRVMQEGIGVVAFGSTLGTEHSRTVAVLTLLPE